VDSRGKKKRGTANLLNGVASLQVAFPHMGDHVLTATYGGDGNFVGSTTPPYSHVVDRK